MPSLYNLYYHSFPHYMLTKNELMLLHIFLLSFLLFVGYGVILYLPAQLKLVLARGYYYLFGTDPIALQ